MSADLFAEFGGSSSNQPSNSLRPNQASHTSSLIPDLDGSEDPFGDFTSPPPQTKSQTTQPKLQSNTPSAVQESNDWWDVNNFYQNADSNVMFDASLEAGRDDDDWGEFEAAETVPQEQPLKTTNAWESSVSSKNPTTLPGGLDLLDPLSFNDEEPPVKAQPAKPVSTKPQIQSKKSLASSTKPQTAKPISTKPQIQNKKPLTSTKPIEPPEDDAFEDWGDFTDGPATQPISTSPAKVPASKGVSQQKTVPQAQKSSFSSQSPVPAGQVRPTNIPPPSVLLELFPQLLEQLRQEAFKAKKSPQKEELEYVASLITCILKSAARVIAGRTLRWKRDTILSQSMRIGPARAGKAGGMKLNSVNKNEDIQEQQEAVDVISMWRDRSAIFNSTIQAAGKRPIPVIAENVRAITAPASQGAIKASHSCALCGLKRDERLPKLDQNVEDSFGEWWTDHWGHTECRQFWETNMNLLNQR